MSFLALKIYHYQAFEHKIVQLINLFNKVFIIVSSHFFPVTSGRYEMTKAKF